jgi:Zn-dependent peptidase ImmA (M78 family)
MKKDDSSLDVQELDNVKKHAKKLLHKADVIDQLPTPVDHILGTAKLFVNKEISLGKDEGFLSKLSKKMGKVARPHIHGFKKLLGMLYVPSGEIYLDHSLHENKKKFIKLHETGHGFLPHQSKMYEFMEDGMLELDPEVKDLFEREANNFAVELLFQLDKFEKMAADYEITIKTPIDLSRKFGSSIYAGMRRYVQTHFAPLALAVYDLPKDDKKFTLRRMPMYSESFIKKFGRVGFPNPCDEFSDLGSLIKFAKLRTEHRCGLKDLNGDTHETAVHIFSNSYVNFIMLIPVRRTSNKNQEFYIN